MTTPERARHDPEVLSAPPSRPSRARGMSLVALTGVLWGTIGPVVGAAHDATGISVLALSGYRSLLGAALVVLVVVVALRAVRTTRGALGAHRRGVVAVGLLTAAFQTLFFVAVPLAGAGVTTVVALGSAPVALTLATAIRHRRPPGLVEVAPVVIALVGLALVGLPGEQAPGSHPGWGLVVALASGLAYAGSTHAGADIARHLGPLALTTGTTLVLAAVAPFTLAAAALLGDPLTGRGPGPWWAVLHLGAVTLVLAYGLLYAGLRSVSGAAVAVVTLLEPVVAVVLAVVVLDERLPAVGWLGTVLVLSAVVFLVLESRGPRSRPSRALVP